MAKTFSVAEWRKIHDLMKQGGEDFGLPKRSRGSVVMGSFNIRKLGARDRKSAGAWTMLSMIAERFDLLAVQEVQDDLTGLNHLKDTLGNAYGMAASDITGGYPGRGASPERLAFLFRWAVVERTEIASDITYDRSSVIGTLFDGRDEFSAAFDAHAKALRKWEQESKERKRAGNKARAKPVVHLPEFVTFIRQPLCVSFQIPVASGTEPYKILAVNAHLLYGKYKDERYKEFLALVGWLVDRGKKAAKMYYPNIILFGDCNLDFKNPVTKRDKVSKFIKSRNKVNLKRARAKINFPFLDVHPGHTDVFRTNARLSETYDQIGLVVHDTRLPGAEKNRHAGTDKPDGFDYGVFNFVDLFSQALHGKHFSSLTKAQRKTLIGKFEHDFTDHMPIWLRLPKPS